MRVPTCRDGDRASGNDKIEFVGSLTRRIHHPTRAARVGTPVRTRDGPHGTHGILGPPSVYISLLLCIIKYLT